jgi:hypothetical protein
LSLDHFLPPTTVLLDKGVDLLVRLIHHCWAAYAEGGAARTLQEAEARERLRALGYIQ